MNEANWYEVLHRRPGRGEFPDWCRAVYPGKCGDGEGKSLSKEQVLGQVDLAASPSTMRQIRSRTYLFPNLHSWVTGMQDTTNITLAGTMASSLPNVLEISLRFQEP